MCVCVCVCVCVMEGGTEKESVCASYLALKKKKKKRNSGNCSWHYMPSAKIIYTLSPFGLHFQVEVVLNENQVENVSLVPFKRLYIMRFLLWWAS